MTPHDCREINGDEINLIRMCSMAFDSKSIYS